MVQQSSQTALYGELLTLEQQYRHDIAPLPHYTEQEEKALVERARQGEKEARDALVLSFTGYVTSLARKYTRMCSSSTPCIEFLDLVQIGNLAILERLDKALDAPNPLGYLRRCASGVILDYCGTRNSLITTPKDEEGNHRPSLKLESLNAPAYQEKNGDPPELHEVLCVDCQLPGPEKDFTFLYQALDRLTEKQREMVNALFGLTGSVESLTEFGNKKRREKGLEPVRSGGISTEMKRQALATLQEALKPLSPQFTEVPEIWEQQEEALAAAYIHLGAQGEEVTAIKLAKRAHVAPFLARLYLHKRQGRPQQRSVQERLQEAYVLLQARGEKITTERLRQEAHCKSTFALEYLRSNMAQTASQAS